MKERFVKLSIRKKAMLIVLFELLCLIIVCIPITVAFINEKQYGGILNFMFFTNSASNGNLDLSVDSYDNKVFDNNMLYSFELNEFVDKTIIYNENEYHIIIPKDGKSITVNGKEIYKTDEHVDSIYYLEDILIFNVSGIKDKLISIDFYGNINIIDEQKAIISIAGIEEKSIRYFVKSYDRLSDEIYLAHFTSEYKVDYIGNNKFSKVRFLSSNVNYTKCINEYNGYCLLNNDSRLRIELKNPNYASDVFTSYLKINGHELAFDEYYIDEIRLLDDGYLYVSLYDVGIGFDNNVYIINPSGDIVNDANNFIASFMIDSSKYEDGIITYYTDRLDSPITACLNLKDNGLELNSIVFKSVDLKYIGNGKLNVINREESTLSEYLEYYDFGNCDDLIKSWEKGNFKF